MITADKLFSIDKCDMQEAAVALCNDDLSQLVEWLSEKDDKLRYQSLLLLQQRSESFDDVYPFWDILCGKLKSANSYQRSIGLLLIADNVKWDKTNRFDNILEDYLMLLEDEKPITVRQCIQALGKIVGYKTHLHSIIAGKLMSIELMKIKETMQKSILLDILGVLVIIRKYGTSDEIEGYLINALSGGMLDKKGHRQIEDMLKL